MRPGGWGGEPRGLWVMRVRVGVMRVTIGMAKLVGWSGETRGLRRIRVRVGNMEW